MTPVCTNCGVAVPATRTTQGKPRKCEECKAAVRKACTLKWRQTNKLRSKQVQAEYRKNNPLKRLLAGARKRANAAGLPFDLTEADVHIPPVCPALGIPLAFNKRVKADNSPSLDRLVPARGYVKGNVVVISDLANRIKTNASASEIRAVADWLEAELRKEL